jgi:hypothetical protein
MMISEKFAGKIDPNQLRECSDCGRLLIAGDEHDEHDCDGSEILDPEYFEEKADG